jgi:hypothetical protein
MMLPLKDCMKLMRTFPESLKTQENDALASLKKYIVETKDDVKS